MKIFDSISQSSPKRNKFDLSHEVKLSCNMGELIPILTQEIIPGDSFKVNTEILLRFAPLLAPLMHRIDVYTHSFFVPNRIIWDEWEDFITGGPNGDLTPVWPNIVVDSIGQANFYANRIPDYMGVPPVVPDSITSSGNGVSALPFRAYLEIYNEYFLDQNLQTPYAYDHGSGTVPSNDRSQLTQVRIRAWEKDYFTSALPWSQRGAEAQIPLGTITPDYKANPVISRSATFPAVDPSAGALESDTADSQLANATTGDKVWIDNLNDMPVDPVSINDLRKASRLQEWLELSARAGSRYIEQIKAHFGVRSSDARMQRPEYLGGGKQPVSISEVLNTAGSATGTPDLQPVGEMAGHGISVGSNHGFKRSFEEHGIVITLLSVLPRTAYQNGVERMWQRKDKFDYYWPKFAHLGEQEIKTKEIFLDWLTGGTDNDATWGYQQRYAEYKYKQSSVHGDFRNTLKFWQMAREFSTAPSLNEAFIKSDPRTDIFAVQGADSQHLWIQVYHKISAMRPIPYFSIPEL